eukprot:3549645-Amphidinium_carterae.1
MPSGSIPASLLVKVDTQVSALIARMPPSGSRPVKRLHSISMHVDIASIALKPPSGSIPVK